MLTKLQYTVSAELIQEAISNIPSEEFRYSLNEPLGDFFYDNWKLKDEFVGTVWEKLYNSLPEIKGEARLIQMSAGQCYASHADIDDRYHLNLSGNNCYLIDLDNKEFHQISADGYWYSMDAGRKHSAANFGNRIRYQLVIRKLLKDGNIVNPIDVQIRIRSGIDKDDARFLFDDKVSTWLNKINKQYQMSDFKFQDGTVSFKLDQSLKQELENIIPEEFELLIK